MSIRRTATWLLLLASMPLLAADRESPDYLRHAHAGTATFASDRPVSELYPVLLESARRCWSGEAAPGAGTGMSGGAMGAMSSARRVVIGELAPDGTSAFVAVQVRGFFGATHMNFLQVDLAGEGNRSTIVAYHRNNVALQRGFLQQVQHWIDGDPAYCDTAISRGIRK